MELTVLVDNNTHAGNCLLPEHGLSFFIEEEKHKLLFDCGSTDAFIKNAHKMQIDLEQVTDIILSHSHADHIGGFLRLESLYKNFKEIGISFNSKNVISHPNVFQSMDDSEDATADESLHLCKDKLDKCFKLKLTEKPFPITSKLIYLGEIPIIREVKKDYAPDEIALAYKSKDGLVIISGCSHSGIENIIDHAKHVTGVDKINTIIGGLYLINRSEDEIHALGKYLQEQNIDKIFPCHCTDLEAKIILSKYIKIEDVSTGQKYNWQ